MISSQFYYCVRLLNSSSCWHLYCRNFHLKSDCKHVLVRMQGKRGTKQHHLWCFSHKNTSGSHFLSSILKNSSNQGCFFIKKSFIKTLSFISSIFSTLYSLCHSCLFFRATTRFFLVAKKNTFIKFILLKVIVFSSNLFFSFLLFTLSRFNTFSLFSSSFFLYSITSFYSTLH